MMDMETKDPLAVKLGARGGRATIKKYGKKHMRKLSKIAVAVRHRTRPSSRVTIAMSKGVYLEIYNAGNKNASDLLKTANLLCNKDYFAQAYVLAYTALEEISKSQFAADVFTGLCTGNEFKKFYRAHEKKIAGINWAHDDANSYPHKYKWIGPDMDDVEEMNPDKPLFSKRQAALYVDIDFGRGTISKPSEVISEKDARDIIHIVEVALERIWEITGEFGGMQIGTKGFMK